MTIQVVRPETDFTLTPNALIQDESLSIAARGLWVYLASLPASWQVRAAQLQRAIGVGKDKLQGLCRELEGAGLLSRSPNRLEGGRVHGQVWALLLPGVIVTAAEIAGRGRVPENTAGGADRVPEKPAAGSTGSRKTRLPIKKEVRKKEKEKDERESARETVVDLRAEEAECAAEAPALVLTPPEPEDRPRPPKRATALSEIWAPSPETVETCKDILGVGELDLLEILVRFKDHHAAKGSTFKDWDAAFRTWCRREGDFRARRPG